MSKRHQASRRRTYGRRQHEIHERPDRQDDSASWLEGSELQQATSRWGTEPADTEVGGWLQSRGIN
ncbi:MAG TPA: hypothetical protein VIK06_01425 [Candidatus Limnocylindrales bacterium]